MNWLGVKQALLLAGCLACTACQAGTMPEASPASAAPETTQAVRIMASEPMPSPRAAHSSTRLRDGRVLLAGGCTADGCEEGIAGDAVLFNPVTSGFAPAGKLQLARVGHRAVALADGSVLLLGGWTRNGATAVVERYDPEAGTFEVHGHMLQARDGFSATLIADGSILIAGGYAEGMRRLPSAERYDPATGISRSVGALSDARMSHTATSLADGRVLVAGGSNSRDTVLASLEIFDPASDTFSPAGTLARSRHKHAAVRFGERVLFVGGASIPEADGHFNDSEWWTPQGIMTGPNMAAGRYKFLDSLATLEDGRVLVAGGGTQAELLDAEGTAFEAVSDPIGAQLAFATATVLDDGRILVAGGYDSEIRVTRRAWLASAAVRAGTIKSPTLD